MKALGVCLETAFGLYWAGHGVISFYSGHFALGIVMLGELS